jgi:hypothetical protein
MYGGVVKEEINLLVTTCITDLLKKAVELLLVEAVLFYRKS